MYLSWSILFVGTTFQLTLPEVWACISQPIDYPPLFHEILHDVCMPDIIAARYAVLGKLGRGACSEVIGNGYKPVICSL